MSNLSNVKRFKRMVATHEKLENQIARLESMVRIAEQQPSGYRFHIGLGEHNIEAEPDLVLPAIKKRLYQAKMEVVQMDQIMTEMLELCSDEADEADE